MAWRRRDFHERPSAMPGVIRVDCIGDSMMHGAGALPDHAFPAHCGRQLNATFPNQLFHVVNFGLEGGNLWNTWSLFKARWREGRCDAIVFSVCANDIRVLEWWGLTYNWRDDDVAWGSPILGNTLAIRLLDDIEAFMAETGLPVVVFYYDLRVLPAEMTNTMRSLFGERSFLYFQTATDIRAELDSMTFEERVVNLVDGHPSSRAHEIAARYLARQAKRRGLFARLPEADPLAIPDAIIRTADAMIEDDAEADAALAWADETLAAKEAGLRRSVALDQLDTISDAIQHARSALRRRAEIWTHVTLLPLLGQRVIDVRARLSEELVSIDFNLQAVEELMQELTLAHDDPELAAEIAALLSKSSWVTDNSNRPRPPAPAWRPQIHELRRIIDAAMAEAFPSFPGGCGPLGRWGESEITGWRRKLRPLLAPIPHHIDRLERVLCAIDAMEASGGPTSAITSARTRISFAQFSAQALIATYHHLRRPNPGSFARFQTRIELVIDLDHPADVHSPGIQLCVTVHYRIPVRLSVIQSHHVGVVKATETYVLEFPLLVAGDVMFEIRDYGNDPDFLPARGLTLRHVTVTNLLRGPDGDETIERRFEGPHPNFTSARLDGLTLY